MGDLWCLNAWLLCLDPALPLIGESFGGRSVAIKGSGWGSSLLVGGRGYLPSLKKARPPTPKSFVLSQDKMVGTQYSKPL